jgi:undecaprenyl-diphosphatase
LKTSSQFSGGEWVLLAIGFVIAFVVALATMKWFLHFIERYTFTPFGVYRVIVALILSFLVLF